MISGILMKRYEEENMIRTKIVNSIAEVDLDGIRQPMIAIYDHPDDFPNKVVARIWIWTSRLTR